MNAYADPSDHRAQFAIGLAVRELLLSRDKATTVLAAAANATATLPPAGGDGDQGKLQVKVSEVALPAAAESAKAEPTVPPEEGDADGRDAAGAALAGWNKGKWSLGDWVSTPAHTLLIVVESPGHRVLVGLRVDSL